MTDRNPGRPVPGLARLTGEDGEPGSQATGQPEATPPRPPGRIPAGPRGDPASGETDWVRAIGQRRL
jgi:hypothetical protein